MHTVYTLDRFDIEFLAGQALEDERYPKERKKIYLRSTGLMAWNGSGTAIQLELPIPLGQNFGTLDAKKMQDAIKACKAGRKKAPTIDLELCQDRVVIAGQEIGIVGYPVSDKLFEFDVQSIRTLDQDTIEGLALCKKLGAELALFDQGKLQALDKDKEIGIGYKAPNSPISDGKIVSTWIGSIAKAAQKAGYKEPIMIGRTLGLPAYALQIGPLRAITTDIRDQDQIKKSSFCLERAS